MSPTAGLPSTLRNGERHDPCVGQLLNRIRGEYDEMPDLKLTSWQACRLWNLTTPLCISMLETLVSERFLTRSADGAYLRGGTPRPSEGV